MEKLWQCKFKDSNGKIWTELFTEQDLCTTRFAKVFGDYQKDGCVLVGELEEYIEEVEVEVPLKAVGGEI